MELMNMLDMEMQMVRILLTIFFLLLTPLFYVLIIEPKQDSKNQAKQKRAEEAASRAEADKAFDVCSSLFNNEPGRSYENSLN